MTEPSLRPARRRALIAVSLGMFTVLLETFALNLTLPAIGRDFDADGEELQWVISSSFLATGTLMLAAGRAGDILGRRRLLVFGLVSFGVASLVCALAPSLPVLVAARMLQGAGGASIMPASLALLTNTFPPGLRGRATGYALGAGGIATAVGPFAGGVLAETLSWRVVFGISVPLAALTALLVLRVPESRDPSSEGPMDWQGLVAGTTALAAVAVYLDRSPSWGPLSAGCILALALGVGSAIIFVRVERRATSPFVRPALFRNRRYVALTVAGGVANAATVVFLFVVPLSLQGIWELSSSTAGIVFVAPAIAMAVAGPVAGRVPSDRAATVMAACLGAGAAGLLLLSFAGSVTSLPAYVGALVGCAGALGLANALTLTATQAVIAPDRAGEASGVTKSVITIAGGFGVMLSGAALTGAMVACLVAGVVLTLWIRAGGPHRRAAGDAGERQESLHSAAPGLED